MAAKSIQSILVLGGGSAGFLAAITLKRKVPALKVQVLRSPDLDVMGLGEGTTLAFPKHIFEYLKLKPRQFYEQAEPTWKLGTKFLWGPRPEFYSTFAYEFQQRFPELSCSNGYYFTGEPPYAGPISAFMAQDKAFPRRPDGTPQFHNSHAFHLENKKLVGWLTNVARDIGVEAREATVTAERGPDGIAALISESGERLTADLYVDASGFRSELLGRTLEEPFLSYAGALFCDHAIMGGWPRTDEPIKPYTLVETMDSGWCWQFEHERWIDRGYVYASAFVRESDAHAELLRKNPKMAGEPRGVEFRSGRYARNWVGNVVAVGNAAGFVEPLAATALQRICVAASTLADALIDSLSAPAPTLIQLYNEYNARAWDDLRDFLAVHYKFNTRLDTPFWRACRQDTPLHEAAFLVDFYQENGPSVVAGSQLLHSSNSFGMDGYLALLLGQNVPHARAFTGAADEVNHWRDRGKTWAHEARRGLDVKQCLEAIRKGGVAWT